VLFRTPGIASIQLDCRDSAVCSAGYSSEKDADAGQVLFRTPGIEFFEAVFLTPGVVFVVFTSCAV